MRRNRRGGDTAADEPEVKPAAGTATNSVDITLLRSCSVSDLTIPMATALASALVDGLLPYARFVGCRRTVAFEAVCLDLAIEVPQRAVYDIRDTESIAILFSAKDMDGGPEVLALRSDFPQGVPHTNLRPYEYPTSLCLYDVPFRDVRAQWTPARFVELIREWLRLTALGALHADDQPLEPLLGETAALVILPASIRSAAANASDAIGVSEVGLAFRSQPEHEGRPVLLAVTAGEKNQDPTAVGAVVRVRPRTHGAIRRAPRTLADLQQMLQEDGDDLVGALRAALGSFVSDAKKLAARFLLILLVPMRRAENAPVEEVQTWAIFSTKSLAEVGEAIGAWALVEGAIGRIMQPDSSQDGRCVQVALANPVYLVTRDDLARLNGRAAADERRIVAIGGGALGSQITDNAVRGAFGRWTLIDADLMLPHNLARHQLPRVAVGYHKAAALAAVANTLTDEGDPVHEALVADVLAPVGDALAGALRRADVIADFSASVTVERALARDVDAPARRVCVYLSPSGHDLTMLVEDATRAMTLDVLEMQLYRAIGERADLSDLFARSSARLRYGRSCRDVTVQLPQALVGLHAGIATLAFQEALSRPDPEIRVWRVDPDTFAVRSLSISPTAIREVSLNGWQVITDISLLERLHSHRASRLPNETGGVLLGAYDLKRRIVYVVATILSPSDSHEYPSSYLRGTEGLSNEVDRLFAATDGQLHYVGEWHSHPSGHSCRPSGDDRTLFNWLSRELSGDAIPALMMIVGDNGLTAPFIERIDPSGTLAATLPLGRAYAG